VTELVLSLFPGVGLFDRGFEDAGFCVVRGPDKIWGGDVRKFHIHAGAVTGVIGGPPCQDFSRVRRAPPTGEGMELIGEFLRIVTEAQPEWWLMENVGGSPSVTLPGYVTQMFNLDASHLGSDQGRLRKFHFGHRPGTREIVIPRPTMGDTAAGASQRTCLASEGKRVNRRSWPEFCRLQGLPEGFDLEPFTMAAKYQAVGNGVPYPMALALAEAIKGRGRVTPHKTCECGCGLFVTGRQRLATAACRKRMERRRDDEPDIVIGRQFNLPVQYEAPFKV
jgi:DNA (cytosine-5)-methyltransferase 1